MSEMTMIERVARAMDVSEDTFDFELYKTRDGMRSAVFAHYARAALEAIRPLSDDIAGALKEHFDNDNAFGTAGQVQAIWCDAIDAALAEKA